jgi:hypothetical protein
VSAATHILTARSRSGRPLNMVTGGPVECCAVYGLADLARRLAAAARDPDLEVTVRRLPGSRRAIRRPAGRRRS